jgi:hypothetical protein
MDVFLPGHGARLRIPPASNPTTMSPTPAPDDVALERLLADSRRFEDAPESVIQRAIGVWTSRPAGAMTAAPVPAPGGVLRRLAAALSFDSLGLAPQAAGVRSIGSDGVRQLLFTADGRDIDLRVAPSADGRHWQLSGQVLGPDESGRAELRCGGLQARADWSELAEFRFDDVPAGACELCLRGTDWELVLPVFDIPGR